MRSTYIWRRLLSTVPLLLVVSALVFGLTYFVPGDPAVTIAGERATVDDIERVRTELGLDRPAVVQYWSWLGGVLSGDLGESLTDGRPVGALIAQRIEATLLLSAAALAIATVFGVLLGMLGALRAGSLVDRTATLAATLSVAVPPFWIGILLVIVFGVILGLFPATGYVSPRDDVGLFLRHLTLPVLALSAVGVGEVARQTRTAFGRTLSKPHIETAYMKGLPYRRIFGVHALKDAAPPIVAILGVRAIYFLSGAVIIESLFGIGGLGSLSVAAVTTRDIPVVQGIVLITTCVAVVVNLATDVVTAKLDPRLART